MNSTLHIKNLHVKANQKPILNGLNLSIKPGQIHALMGPNGSGKSTLGNTLMGHPAYTVTDGQITLGRKKILSLSTEERAQLGIFLAFQQPLAIPGVPFATFLRQAVNTLRQANSLPPLPVKDFLTALKQHAQDLNLPEELLKRAINEGLSGGERKKIETIQLLMLSPKIIVLDELDTGTDVDSLKLIGQTIHKLSQNPTPPSIIIITHYNRIFKYIKPHFVHVIKSGQIVTQGSYSLVNQINKHGYGQW